MWFETIKAYYKKELYNNDDVKVFVIAKMIDKEEYQQITNEDYIV